MKKIIHVAAMCIGIAGFVTTSGCSTFFDNPETAYDVGSKVTGVYVVGRPFIPQEERAVIREVYVVLRDSESIRDVTVELIKNVVAIKARDMDEATVESMAALFIGARADLLGFVTDGMDAEQEKAIKDAFFKGVEDKLAAHNITVARDTDKASLLKLIDEMN